MTCLREHPEKESMLYVENVEIADTSKAGVKEQLKFNVNTVLIVKCGQQRHHVCRSLTLSLFVSCDVVFISHLVNECLLSFFLCSCCFNRFSMKDERAKMVQ